MGLKTQYQIKRQQRYRARKKRRKAGALKTAGEHVQQQGQNKAA